MSTFSFAFLGKPASGRDFQDILGSRLGGQHILGNSHIGLIVFCKYSSQYVCFLACASWKIPASHHFHGASSHPDNQVVDAFWCWNPPVAAKKISGENNGSSWCPFFVCQVIGYENVRWVSQNYYFSNLVWPAREFTLIRHSLRIFWIHRILLHGGKPWPKRISNLPPDEPNWILIVFVIADKPSTIPSLPTSFVAAIFS